MFFIIFCWFCALASGGDDENGGAFARNKIKNANEQTILTRQIKKTRPTNSIHLEQNLANNYALYI